MHGTLLVKLLDSTYSPSAEGGGQGGFADRSLLVSFERSTHRELALSIKQCLMSSLSVLGLSLSCILMTIPRGVAMGRGFPRPYLRNK